MSVFTTREVALAALFAALTAVAAFVSIPVGSVPFTLQVLVVLLAGMVLGPRVGAASMAAYLVLGLIVPVYAGGTSGLGVLLGPTGGYLWGFVPAAALTGFIVAEGRNDFPRSVGAGLAGLIPIYALGALWLGLQLHLGALAALATGVAPFVWVDVLKAFTAALVARGLVSLPLGLPSPQRGR
jgi:biotin transport system substrate-specific component